MEEQTPDLQNVEMPPRNTGKKKPAEKPAEQNSSNADESSNYVHGFKVPLELHPQFAGCSQISFMIGSSTYRLSPAEILTLAGEAKRINPKLNVGSIPWKAAIGLFVNNIDGGRNKQLHDTIEASKEAAFNSNLQ